MAVGDVVADIQSITAAARIDIQPGAGVEWVINNIYHEDDITIERFDGTNVIAFEVVKGAGVYAKHNFRVNNTDRIRVQNNHASVAKLIGYDGVQTK